MILFKLLSFFITATLLFGVPVDKTLFESEELVQQYEKILKEKQALENTEQTTFEINILKKLIELQKNPLEFSIPELKNADKSEKNYIDALFTYAETINKKKSNEKKIQELKTNLDTLEDKIENISESSKHKLDGFQLEYAMYKITLTMLQKGIESFDKKRDALFTHLQASKHEIDFDVNFSQKGLQSIEQKIDELLANKRLKLIDIETFKLEDKKEKVELIQKELDELNQQLNQHEIQRFRFLIVTIIDALKSKDKKVFNIYKKLEDIEIKDELNKSLRNTIKEMIAQEMGTTQTVISNTKESFIDLIIYSWEIINKPIFVYDEKEISIFSFVKIIFIFTIGLFIAWFYKFKLLRSQKLTEKISLANRTLIANLGYYFIFFITFLVALNTIGLDLSSFALIAGALSVGIGFGLQNIVSNFISGIILMFEKTIRIDDIIEIDATAFGQVSRISMRSTIITTFDNIDIIVPNSSFIQNNVINYTYGDETRRLHIPFGVAYGTPVQKVKDAIFGALEKSELKFINEAPNKQPDVWMVNMNSSSVDYELLVWIDAGLGPIARPRKKDFLELIYNALYENDIEIPFPQMDLHLRSTPNGVKGLS